jgi:hypothetical protein
MKWILALGGVLIAASASAQPRPGAFTTITATDATATGVCIGCPLGDGDARGE